FATKEESTQPEPSESHSTPQLETTRNAQSPPAVEQPASPEPFAAPTPPETPKPHESVAADMENFVEAMPTPLPGTPSLEDTWDMRLPDPVPKEFPALTANMTAKANGESSVSKDSAADERFRLLMGASNDGIWDWNLRSRSGYFSPRW